MTIFGLDIRDIFSGLIGAVILGTVLTAIALLIVHLTVAERPRWWALRGFAWLAAACTLGVAGSALLMAVIAGITELPDGVMESIAGILPRTLVLIFWFAEVAVLFLAIPYLPLMLLWARLGPKLGWLENTTRGVCASAAILSLPAFMIIHVASGNPSPTRPTVIRGILSITLEVGMIAICLALPRLVIPFLRPGALASRGVS